MQLEDKKTANRKSGRRRRGHFTASPSGAGDEKGAFSRWRQCDILEKSAPEGLAVLTDEQTGGRGRRGNAFQSLKGKGLYCSILLRPRLVLDLDKLSTLTAWVAVAASRAVEACCGLRPGIKWTNDLVLGGRKLCGILTELELEAETGEPSAVIAGIGINVGQTDGDFGPALSRVATSLEQELGSPVRRADLAVCLLRALDDIYAAFPAAKAD